MDRTVNGIRRSVIKARPASTIETSAPERYLKRTTELLSGERNQTGAPQRQRASMDIMAASIPLEVAIEINVATEHW